MWLAIISSEMMDYCFFKIIYKKRPALFVELKFHKIHYTTLKFYINEWQ